MEGEERRALGRMTTDYRLQTTDYKGEIVYGRVYMFIPT